MTAPIRRLSRPARRVPGDAERIPSPVTFEPVREQRADDIDRCVYARAVAHHAASVSAVERIRDCLGQSLAPVDKAGAVGLAGRIVSRELNSQDHSQLIREALDQLPSRN